MKKPLREKGNEKERNVKEKEKGLPSENLYTIQESEKPYCTAKELINKPLHGPRIRKTLMYRESKAFEGGYV